MVAGFDTQEEPASGVHASGFEPGETPGEDFWSQFETGEAPADLSDDDSRRDPPLLASVLSASIERIERRCSGREKPIELPWPVLAEHFGGGLWPGLHIINSGTGVGKTQWALQAGIHAARSGIPVLYIGLELGELDLAVRLLGNEAHVPWSHLWTGTASAAYVQRVVAAAPALNDLPFHYEVSRPHGFAPSDVRAAVDAIRTLYPEIDGPGSRPLLVVVDFLQLIGDEPHDEKELRVRVGRASYVLRDLANCSVAVLCISSIARERYRLLDEIHSVGGLAWDTDASGYPTKRRILKPDAIVGAGKESGDIEYSADSVSIIARVAETWDGTNTDVVFATAKGRATGATWSPLRFTGFAYQECSDRGGRMVDAWRAAAERGSAKKAEKEKASALKKESTEADKIAAARTREQQANDRRAQEDRALVKILRAHPAGLTGDQVRAAMANIPGGCGHARSDATVMRLGERVKRSRGSNNAQLHTLADEEVTS